MKILKQFCNKTLALLTLALTLQGGAQPVEIPGRGSDTITFPNGEASWADQVSRFTPGNPAAWDSYSVPDESLGRPNDASTSLGRGGTIVLEFVDNRLVDVEGYDLYIFEIGPQVEDTKVEISQDGTNWIDVGTVTGSTSYVEIGPYVSPGQQFRYVRLTDDPNEGGRSGKSVGADIDAIGAIGSVSGSDIQPEDDSKTQDDRKQISRYFDAVNFYLPGTGGYTVGDRLPQSALRRDQGSMGGSSLRLGEGGSLVLLMADYVAVNRPGQDLFVFGEFRGPIQVDVSKDLTNWVTVGSVTQDGEGVDMGSLSEARYVRLIEKADGRQGTVIDAVGAAQVRLIK